MRDETTAAWRDTLAMLLDEGQEIAQESMDADWRGRTNRELLAFQTTIPMSQPIVLCPVRKMGYRFMAAEPAAILSGDNRLETIRPFAKQMATLSEDGLTMAGHYGPPFRDQVNYVLSALRKDASSRQAVCALWRPRPSLETRVPCTLTLQWLIRENKLNCLVSMRSSDAWMGLVYDWFAFSMMSTYLAIALRGQYPGLDLGFLTVTAGSQHLYKIDWEHAEEAIEDDVVIGDVAPIDLMAFDHPDRLTDHLWAFARREPLQRGWLSDLDALIK